MPECRRRHLAPCIIPMLAAAAMLCAQADPGKDTLPHVSECSTCQHCWYSQDRDPQAIPPLPQHVNRTTGRRQLAAAINGMVPTDAGVRRRRQLPACEECWGCNTALQPLQAMVIAGHSLEADAGRTEAWVFLADLPPGHEAGSQAVVKVWCLPGSSDEDDDSHPCLPEQARSVPPHQIAVERFARDCGMSDMLTQSWVDRIQAVVPGTGQRVWWNGLWMQKAPGVSMRQLAAATLPHLINTFQLGILQGRSNKTQVLRAAAFELLMGQCDRHAKNVLIDSQGNIKLIDNPKCLGEGLGACSHDSLFLPGTRKFDLIRGGIPQKHNRSIIRQNPLRIMDYRCYAPGGVLGKQLPPGLDQCTRKVAGMSPKQVAQEYGFNMHSASLLVKRATAILRKGFEWTLKCGHTIDNPKQFRLQPMCCGMDFAVEKGGLYCTDERPAPFTDEDFDCGLV